MDRDVSPRIAYWTSAFESHMEAIAAEVALLRSEFPSSVAWGLSHRRWILLSRKRGFCFHPNLHLVFRGATWLFESAFDLHHVFGSLGDWFYLNRPRRAPTVLTVAAQNSTVDRQLIDRVDRFVVEHPGGRAELERMGIEKKKVELIFPPVDLKRFSPTSESPKPFTVLFASSPEESSWLVARGVPQLLDAAALRPEMRFRLLWRPWGNSLGQVRQWINERELRNVDLKVGRCEDMASQYQTAHVTTAMFTDPERSKPSPNSIVESLACGRPVLVSEQVGLAEVIRDGQAGIVCQANGEAIAAALDRLESGWVQYSSAARSLAEKWFGADRFLRKYGQLYAEVLDARRAA